MSQNPNEDLKKTVAKIRGTGSQMNLSMPQDLMKAEAHNLIRDCQTLLQMLGE